MSAINLGVNYRYYISESSDFTGIVEITGIAQGTDNLTAGRSRTTRQVPGRGKMGYQPSRYLTYDHGFTTDFNSATGALLAKSNGQRFYCRVQPTHNKTGGKRIEFQGIFTPSITFDHESDAITISVAVAVDGKPTVATL